MLTADLLRTKVRGNQITPWFVTPENDTLELADDIIGAFKDHTGKKLGELKDILEEIEDQGFDYRLVRGLVALLERRCRLTVESPVDPAEARKAVFKAGAALYPVTTTEARSAAIKKAAEELNESEKAVEGSMFADLENEQFIRQFSPPAAVDLLCEYNLSLAQTLLFKASELTFRASGKHQDSLRAVKRLGLMYSAAEAEGRLDISVDGPMSALKSTERYGTSLAKLLPYIVSSPGWSVEASIVRKDFSGNPRVYSFSMDEKTHAALFGKFSGSDGEINFDSEPEEKFYESFKNAGTGWTISREPEPLITGRYLFIPDFLLEKDGVKVYLEIAGFWTADYLKKKVAKLNEVKDKNLIVLASARMSCDAFKYFSGSVIFFDKKIPLKDVTDRLKVWDEKKAAEGMLKLNESGLKVSGDVVTIERLAGEKGVPADSVKRYVEKHSIPGYTLAGDELIADGVIKGLGASMPEKMQYSDALAMIRSKGVNSVDTVLKILGYTVKWSGLDPENATVYRIH